MCNMWFGDEYHREIWATGLDSARKETTAPSCISQVVSARLFAYVHACIDSHLQPTYLSYVQFRIAQRKRVVRSISSYDSKLLRMECRISRTRRVIVIAGIINPLPYLLDLNRRLQIVESRCSEQVHGSIPQAVSLRYFSWEKILLSILSNYLIELKLVQKNIEKKYK